MTATGFLGGKQPGSSPAFWQKACEAGRYHACRTFAHTLDVACQENSGPGCFTLGMLLESGNEVPRNAIGAARSFGRACEIGLPYGCMSLARLVGADGPGVLSQPCDQGDGPSCVTLGTLYLRGQGVARDQSRALDLFRQSCALASPRGCGLVGESYLFGQGTAVNAPNAIENLEKACQLADSRSCFNAGLMYRRGFGTSKNEELAQKRIHQACDLGFRGACRVLQEAALHPVEGMPPASR